MIYLSTSQVSLRLAVSVPVNADGERGYGDENEIKETVRRLIALGVAGMNLEDGAGGKPGGARGLVELSQQLRKIKAVMETKRALGSEFFSMPEWMHSIS